MSMILEVRALTSDQFAEVMADPAKVEDFLYGDEDDVPVGPAIDLDKAWHGVHYLLTGMVDDAPPPLGLAVLGGRPIGPDNGYGPSRLLTVEDVRLVATALVGVDLDELRRRFDPAQFEAREIYPQGIWQEDDVLEQYLLPSLEELTSFYDAAANSGSAVLLALT